MNKTTHLSLKHGLHMQRMCCVVQWFIIDAASTKTSWLQVVSSRGSYKYYSILISRTGLTSHFIDQVGCKVATSTSTRSSDFLSQFISAGQKWQAEAEMAVITVGGQFLIYLGEQNQRCSYFILYI